MLPDTASALIFPPELCDRLRAEARAGFPRECCGLIEGVRRRDLVEAVRLHPTRTIAERADRFEIDPAEHIRLLRALRGATRGIVGCYHSHPNGAAMPSPRDREQAGEDGFVWLIAAVAGEDCEIAAYLYAAGDFRPLPLRAVA